MKSTGIIKFSELVYLALIWAVCLVPVKLKAQFPTNCVFPSTQPTLCVEYGASAPHFQILTPTQSSAWLGNWTNRIIYINAEFVVNTAFSITNCTLNFGTSGYIKVINGGNLNCFNTKFFGCNGWEGIQIEGTGIINFNENRIEDALNAITIKSSNSQSIITANNFNRNIVDIYVPSAVMANTLITGNLFDCSSNTFQGAKSDIGILTQKSTLPFGLPLGDYNFVRNHRVGAHLYSSNVTMRNVDFDCNDEVGIYAKLGRLDINTDPGFAYINNFFHNRADITTEATNLFVKLTSFSQCQSNNITSIGNIHAQDIELKFNTFNINNDNQFAIDHHKSGILLDRSSGTSGSGAKNNISFNGFNIADFTINEARSAIQVTGYPGTSDRMTISGNPINFLNGGSHPNVARESSLIDIEVNEAHNFDLSENHIRTQNIDDVNNRNRWGFYIHERKSPSSGHTLLGNSVLSINANEELDFGMCAFHFEECGPWSICYNRSDKTLRGFHINEDCSISTFGANILGRHGRSVASNTGPTAALLMQFTPKLGPQYCRKNVFLDNNYAPDRGAEIQAAFPIIAASRFDVDPNVQEQYPVPVNPASGWFHLTVDCGNIPGNHCGGLSSPPYESYINEYEMETILAHQTASPPINASDWEDIRDVYAKLLKYPTLKSLSGAADTFFNVHSSTSAGLYAQWDESLNLSMQIDEEISNELEAIRTDLKELIDSLDAIDRTLTTISEIRNASSSFFYSRHAILTQMGVLQNQEEILINTIDSVRLLGINNCQTALSLLPQNTQYEVNQVFLNELLLKYSTGQTLSSEDTFALRFIALQCPDLAGRTRFRAANWLTPGDLIRQILENGIAPLCDTLERNNRIYPIGHHELFWLWPNPVESSINVSFNSSFTGEITVYSLSNPSPLLIKELNGVINTQLNSEYLTSGVYFLVAKTNNGQSFSRKFVVLK